MLEELLGLPSDVSVRMKAEVLVPAAERAVVPEATNAAFAAVDVLMPSPDSTEGKSLKEEVKLRGVVTEETLRENAWPAKLGRRAGQALTAALYWLMRLPRLSTLELRSVTMPAMINTGPQHSRTQIAAGQERKNGEKNVFPPPAFANASAHFVQSARRCPSAHCTPRKTSSRGSGCSAEARQVRR